MARMKRARKARAERCESGCRKPVTHHDIEGVPLCDDCWRVLIDEEKKDRARGVIPVVPCPKCRRAGELVGVAHTPQGDRDLYRCKKCRPWKGFKATTTWLGASTAAYARAGNAKKRSRK